MDSLLGLLQNNIAGQSSFATFGEIATFAE